MDGTAPRPLAGGSSPFNPQKAGLPILVRRVEARRSSRLVPTQVPELAVQAAYIRLSGSNDGCRRVTVHSSKHSYGVRAPRAMASPLDQLRLRKVLSLEGCGFRASVWDAPPRVIDTTRPRVAAGVAGGRAVLGTLFRVPFWRLSGAKLGPGKWSPKRPPIAKSSREQ